jgi:hypothetical protein
LEKDYLNFGNDYLNFGKDYLNFGKDSLNFGKDYLCIVPVELFYIERGCNSRTEI